MTVMCKMVPATHNETGEEMNPYTDPVTCTLCGGPGAAHVSYGWRVWLGEEFHHRDPEVCKYYLNKKQQEMEREINELRAENKRCTQQVSP